MLSKAPSHGQLTLRFKQHKTTVLVLVVQSQSFTSIKEDLLEAIRATGIEEINGTPLPSDPEAIVFGLPMDEKDLDKGWVPLEIPEVEDGDTKAKGVRKGSVLNQNPLGAGLKNGSIVAFKFRAGQNEESMDDDWDVVIPSYEDEASSQGPA